VRVPALAGVSTVKLGGRPSKAIDIPHLQSPLSTVYADARGREPKRFS
jgi:hypothetical protein